MTDSTIEAIVEYFAGKKEELPDFLEKLSFVEIHGEFGVQFNKIEKLWLSAYDKHFRCLFKRIRGSIPIAKLTLESVKIRFKIAIAICVVLVPKWDEHRQTVDFVIKMVNLTINNGEIHTDANIISIVENIVASHD